MRMQTREITDLEEVERIEKELREAEHYWNVHVAVGEHPEHGQVVLIKNTSGTFHAVLCGFVTEDPLPVP